MSFQRCYGHVRKVDGAAATIGLWLSEGDSPSAAREGVPYVDDPFIEVYILPPKCQKLALSHAGLHSQNIERLQYIPARRFNELASLVW